MNPLEEKIKQITEKLKLLVKQHEGLQKENEKLSRELHELRLQQADKARQMDQLEQKLSLLKAASSQLDETDKKELEKRLSLYIREIDRCMALLGE